MNTTMKTGMVALWSYSIAVLLGHPQGAFLVFGVLMIVAGLVELAGKLGRRTEELMNKEEIFRLLNWCSRPTPRSRAWRKPQDL